MMRGRVDMDAYRANAEEQWIRPRREPCHACACFRVVVLLTIFEVAAYLLWKMI